MYLIGTDEAGYGPNLGPLVICATAWHTPEDVRADGLYEALAGWVSTRADRPARATQRQTPPVPSKQQAQQPPGQPGQAEEPGRPGRIVVADSKTVYQPGKGLGELERTVLAALALLGRKPSRWAEIWPMLDPAAGDAASRLPWYAAHDEPLPVDASPGASQAAADFLAEGLTQAGVRLLEIRACVLWEDEFNRRVAQHGSKGAVLTHATLQLAAETLAPMGDEPICITCDKHGGRNAYASLLDRYFPDRFLEICGESRQKSTYRFGPESRRVEIRFEAGGEAYLATALASMTAKYLRELAMRAINAFWAAKAPGLAPTAGYPVDAKRFKSDVAEAQKQCGIEDRVFWRSR